MNGDDRVKIGTWPTPEMPGLDRFEDRDWELVNDLAEVMDRHGVRGRIIRIEMAMGAPAPMPKTDRDSFRATIPGVEGRPMCMWVCP